MKKIEGLYVTHSSEEEAQKIIDLLIENKLIACANVFPIQSHFFWQGEVQNDDEVVSLLKTNSPNLSECINSIKKNHPYDTPCILHYTMEANTKYAEWIDEMTR